MLRLKLILPVEEKEQGIGQRQRLYPEHLWVVVGEDDLENIRN